MLSPQLLRHFYLQPIRSYIYIQYKLILLTYIIIRNNLTIYTRVGIQTANNVIKEMNEYVYLLLYSYMYGIHGCTIHAYTYIIKV